MRKKAGLLQWVAQKLAKGKKHISWTNKFHRFRPKIIRWFYVLTCCSLFRDGWNGAKMTKIPTKRTIKRWPGKEQDERSGGGQFLYEFRDYCKKLKLKYRQTRSVSRWYEGRRQCLQPAVRCIGTEHWTVGSAHCQRLGSLKVRSLITKDKNLKKEFPQCWNWDNGSTT